VAADVVVGKLSGPHATNALAYFRDEDHHESRHVRWIAKAAMKAVLENWSLVLAGAWNAAILTPDWLSRHLGFPAQGLNLEFPVGNPTLPVRFRFSEVRMVVLPQVLVLAPLRDEEASLTQMEAYARVLLEHLPHTPVTAVGINFDFTQAEPGEVLRRLFRTTDSSALAERDLVVDSIELRRRMPRCNGWTVSLTLAQTQGVAAANLNFHREVQTATDAAALLGNQVVTSRTFALDLLSTVYELHLQDE
jgi:hypothetical protein